MSVMQETLDVDALMKLAAQAARRNDPAEAAALLRRVLASQEQALGPENAERAPSLSNLAMMLERLGENQEAERCYRRAYAVARGAVGPDDPLTQAAPGNLLEFLHATGKLDPLRDDIGDEDAISTPTPAGPAADNVAPRLTLASAEPVPPPAPPPAAPRSPAPPDLAYADARSGAHDLGHLGHQARTSLAASHVDHEVDPARELLADRLVRKPDARHQGEGLESAQGVGRRVRVHGRQRAVVAGVERREQVEGFGAAHLADHDPVGPHAQRVAQQVADRDLTAPLDRRGSALEPNDVRLAQERFPKIHFHLLREHAGLALHS